MPQPPPSFIDAAAALDIAFDPGDLERLGRFLDLLFEANRQFNLTRITDEAEAWSRHVLDSLTLLPFIASAGAERIIDVGSGGGLPGLPLAIVLPDVRCTLLEATGKKALFLEETARALGLENVHVINDRAETIGRPGTSHRAEYDAVTARAVGPLPVLLELTAPLARAGGHVLAIKGERAEAEVEAARPALAALGCEVADRVRTSTGTILVIEKVKRTPQQYPRRPGEPKRLPIG